MKTGIVVQARMGSSRLPGKVLRTFPSGETLLAVLLRRLAQVRHDARIVVATTEEPRDKAIATVCEALGVPVFFGPEEDVLERYVLAARIYDLDPVVRVTGDCPLLDPDTVDRLLSVHFAADADYTRMHDTRRYPRGLGAEVIRRGVLEDIAGQPDITPRQREHVTLYLLEHPERFHIQYLSVPPELARMDLRLTVDTEEDYALVCRVYVELAREQRPLTAANMIRLLIARPDLMAINAHVRQQTL